MEIFSFYVGIIWYSFTGAFGIDLYRWKWLGIKSVVPSYEYIRSSLHYSTPQAAGNTTPRDLIF
jgi:hypothetical protein